MPRNSSGTYTAPVNSWNPAVDGTIIDTTDWNAQLADYVSTFTDSLSRNGDGGMLADLEVDANAISLTEISSPTSPAANNLKVYALDVTGTTKLAYKDSAGTETVLGAGASLTVGSTVIASGTTTRVLYDNAGVLGEYTISGSGNVAMTTSPSFTTPTLGVASATTVNKITLTAPATGATLTLTDGKTVAVQNSLTLAGTDSTTMTFPSTSSTVLTTGNTAAITKGYTVTPNNLGNITSFTIDPSLGNYQYGTNHGAATWTAPASDCAVDILVTNDASAGSITFSGFTVGSSTGSALTTTNTQKFLISIRRINSVSTYSIYALQ